MRLLLYIKEKYSDLTNREIKRALERGACLVNGKIERYASRKIEPGKDKVEFTYIKTEAQAKLEIKATRIVYEDDHMLVYDKEAGHPIMATEAKAETNLHHELKKFLKNRSTNPHGVLNPVHRLDRQTSGLCIFAKEQEALKELTRMFKDKEIKKTYEAIVDGKWQTHKQAQIENYLKLKQKLNTMQIWQVVDSPKYGAKLAVTNYKLIKAYDKYSHLELEPLTGRTHQLRLHMAHLGYPILGDTIYAENFKFKKILDRHLLHAAKLEFQHPITKKRLRLVAEMPEVFKELLKAQ